MDEEQLVMLSEKDLTFLTKRTTKKNFMDFETCKRSLS